MDILRIDATELGLRSDRGGFWKHALADWLAQVGRTEGVTILVHGFRYEPGHEVHDPHDLLFSMRPPVHRKRAISWPAHIGGNVIAFGWPARGSIWRATRAAKTAGLALAALAQEVGRAGHEVSFVGHSLGARAVLTALSHMEAGVAESAILMTAAVTEVEARAALRSGAGRECRVLNITTRENRLFDRLFALSLGRPLSPMVAQGFAEPPGNWTDLRIDCDRTRRRLAAHGWPIRPPARRICHWSAYLRPGLFAVYRAFLAGRLTPGRIGAILGGGSPL